MLNSKLPGLCERKNMEGCLWAKIYLPILVYSVWHSSVKKCISFALPIYFPVWKMRVFFLFIFVQYYGRWLLLVIGSIVHKGTFLWSVQSDSKLVGLCSSALLGPKWGGKRGAIILTVYKKGSAMFHVDSLLWHRRKCRCDEGWFNKQKTKNSSVMPF